MLYWSHVYDGWIWKLIIWIPLITIDYNVACDLMLITSHLCTLFNTIYYKFYNLSHCSRDMHQAL